MQLINCQRPYHVESTGSHPNTEATSGLVSTWMGDRLGTPGAVDFFYFYLRQINRNRSR